MQRVPLTFFVSTLVVFAAALSHGGCSASSSTTDSRPDFGVDTEDARTTVVEVGATEGGSTTCGALPLTCDPDRAEICSRPDDASADSSTDGLADAADVGEIGATDGASDGPPDGAVDGAVDGEADGGLDMGIGSIQACRVVRGTTGSVTTACAPAGLGREESGCRSDAECAPGLACVTNSDPSLARCLPYCCGGGVVTRDAGVSREGQYCTPLPLAQRPTDRVPVWTKLDNCLLLDDARTCPLGSTCTVVTNDARTTCVPIGTQTEGQTCSLDKPCAAGHVCSGIPEARACRKVCKDGDPLACPSSETCSHLPSIPAGFGICAASPVGDGGAGG